MHFLDFISGAPKTFIFQRDSNKTNLGGLFTVLFVAIMIVIIISYLYEYFANPKYSFTYSYDEIYYEDDEMNELYKDDNLYPKMNFSFSIVQSHITKNIKVKSFEGYEIPLGQNYTLEKRISELNFIVLYKCINETSCDLRDEDKYDYIDYIHMNQSNFNLYDLRLKFQGYYCDHQNPISPIKREETYIDFLFSVEHHVEYYTYNWKIYKYEEDTSFSGMLRQASIFYGGEFTDIVRYSIPSARIINETDDNNEIVYYKLISIIQFNKKNF